MKDIVIVKSLADLQPSRTTFKGTEDVVDIFWRVPGISR